jgi:thiamine monophosphate kinase
LGALAVQARLCGKALARADARSGDRFASAGYLGTGGVVDRALPDFAGAYADQNERVFEALQAAVARVTVRHGV